MGEIGDLAVSFARFLSWSLDLPMRDSCSFANLALARRWVGVWTWGVAVSVQIQGKRWHADEETARTIVTDGGGFLVWWRATICLGGRCRRLSLGVVDK